MFSFSRRGEKVQPHGPWPVGPIDVNGRGHTTTRVAVLRKWGELWKQHQRTGRTVSLPTGALEAIGVPGTNVVGVSRMSEVDGG